VGNITHKDGMGDYAYNDPAHVHAVTHINSVQRYWYDAARPAVAWQYDAAHRKRQDVRADLYRRE
jgi:hypothetical protein